jgi:UDP:flavonoid glycosyltransferase YjiC (YdhE family)
MIDQFFWARRLYSLGASPRPIPLRRLTPESLAEAITTVLAEPRYRAATAVLAERVRAEDGAGAVVAAVDRLLSRRA